jgi:hypothetical protein
MVRTAAGTPVPTIPMQGVMVPQSSINPEAFFEATRGERFGLGTPAFPGYGGTILTPIRQTGILAGIWVKFSGSLTVTLGGGTCATTSAWPYNLLRSVRFSANGQSNLVNTRGWSLKARELMQRGDLNDRGVARGIGGASPGTSRTQGTLSLSNENWGVGQNVTAIPGAPTVYPVELVWWVPIAYDKVDLVGAIFAQTSATDLELVMDMATQVELFTLGGAATAVLAGNFGIEAEVYSIPMGGDGQIIVPDLSVFHSIIESRQTGFTVGPNEVRLAGQGVGRQLMRVWFQLLNGTVPSPLAINSTNFSALSWLYGGNTEPQRWRDGTALAYANEDLFSVDFAQFQGFGVMDWASEHAFRDSIDEGSATELRLLIEVANGVSLTSPAFAYVQETLFTGAVGA